MAEVRRFSRECWIRGSLPPPVISCRSFSAGGHGRRKARERAQPSIDLATAVSFHAGILFSVWPIFSKPRDSADLVVIGYWIAVVTQFLVFPAFGFRASLGDNLLLGAVFTGVSLARSYAVRRAFERWRVWREREGAGLGPARSIRATPRTDALNRKDIKRNVTDHQ
jgi:hypothetical protein